MVHIAILAVLWLGAQFDLVNPRPSSMEVWEGEDPRQASCYDSICCQDEEECRKLDSWICDCSEHLHCKVFRQKYKVIGKCRLEEKKLELIEKSVERCTGDKCTGYRGIQAMTQGGSICRYWSDVDDSDGHLGSFDENGLDENYCRNPNGLHDDIWCYTEEDWEYCSLDNDCQSTCVHGTCTVNACKCELGYKGDNCNEECCTEPSCRSYRGKIATTISGKTCQAWNKQTPHKHTRTPQNYPLSGLVNNYCRNPDGEPWAWCYTMETRRYERCNIPRCEGSCDSTWKAGNDKTSDPKTCKIYAERNYCAGGTYGSGWDNGWGTFENYADSKGRTALVCLECGCKADDLQNWFSRANNNNNN